MAEGNHWMAQRMGMTIEAVHAELARLEAENDTRVPCRHCRVRILPRNLARHESLHEETE